MKISDRQSQTIDPSTLVQFIQYLGCHPRVPMMPELPIGHFGTEHLTKGVHIECGRILSLAKELIKERGRDPRFQDHVATEIDTTNLIVERSGVFIRRARHGIIVSHEMRKDVRIIVTDNGVTGNQREQQETQRQ